MNRFFSIASLASLLLFGVAKGAAAQAEGSARADAIIQAQCFLCHGMQGELASPLFPRLSAQNADYIAKQLADFQRGTRKSTTMQPMVLGLTAGDFKALGVYFAAQPAHSSEDAVDPTLLASGRQLHMEGAPSRSVPACSGCHGAAAEGTAQMPRLAGQHPRYLETQLRKFHGRERINDNAVMQTLAGRLSELEIKAVAGFLSALK